MDQHDGCPKRMADLAFGGDAAHPVSAHALPAHTAICNYAGDAGGGSQTFAASDRWRRALLGTVAAGALLFGYGRRAYAACTGSGATLTCTGDLSAGVNLNNGSGPYTTLNVYSLTADIAPTNADGIRFYSNGSIIISSDLGTHSIQTTRYGIDAKSSVSGSVSVTSTGNVRARNSGIYAKSYDGSVKVDSHGDVTSTAARGIYAHSNGSGDTKIYSYGNVNGSLVGIEAYSLGSVTVKSTGDVTSTTSDAIYTNGSTAKVTLYSGTINGAARGVEFGGTSNYLYNYATVSGGNFAIHASGGSTYVRNEGTVTGNVFLHNGTFNNRAGGVFNSGDTVNLGTGTLTNEGTLAPSPYGVGSIGATSFYGNLIQTASGVLAIDIDMAGSSADSIEMNASGTARLSGGVALNFANLTPVPQTFPILSSAASIPVQSLSLLNPAVVGQIAYPGGTNVTVTISGFDFGPAGLNANQTSIGDNLNAAFDAGSGGVGSLLLALANLTSLSDLASALDQLSPEIMSDAQISALYSSLGFANSLLSCKVNGTDTASIIREGQCLWAGASAVFLDQGTTSQQIGFNQSTGLFAAGAQVALDPVWRFGFGASYQQTSLDTATNATSEGQMGQGGVVLKYNPGPFLLAGLVSGGHGRYDTTRPIAFDGLSGTATSASDINVLNGGVRAAYVLGSPHFYWKPMLDAAATRLDLSDFTESGGGAANLAVAGSNQTVYTIAPSLEIGTEWWIANGTLVRPYLRGGATWYENGNLALTASFLGAPAGVSPFTI